MAAVFSRTHIDLVNNNKIQSIYDFAFGVYIAQSTFFEELSRIQSELVTDGKVTLRSGVVASLEDIGGNLAISLEMEALDTAEQAMTGLGKLGMKIENKIWKQI
jgi:2-oxo-4-hydroxy-4-carboxy--5-ureidoimidazoline (OHCU) decarboxylase